MSTWKAWAIAVATLIVFGILVMIGRDKTMYAYFWVMAAVLWLVFVLLVSTVVSRGVKRRDRS